MKKSILFLFVIFSIFSIFSCNNDDDSSIAPTGLENSPILGKFEITSRCSGTDDSDNIICPLIVLCCDFLTLEDDTNTKDKTGIFTSVSEGQTYNGIFTLNETDNSILFVRSNGSEFTMTYNLNNNGNTLSLKEYQDNNIDFDLSDWKRIIE